jgi:hypothetical protein
MIMGFPVIAASLTGEDDGGLRQGWGRKMQHSVHFHARFRRIKALLSR